MKNFTGNQKEGKKLSFSCQAENIEEAIEYFKEKSSIECDVVEDEIQEEWYSTNGYEGIFIKRKSL
jgi:hypothetical protein